jgi:hypothetical protein
MIPTLKEALEHEREMVQEALGKEKEMADNFYNYPSDLVSSLEEEREKEEEEEE